MPPSSPIPPPHVSGWSAIEPRHQLPPVLFAADGNPAFLGNVYRGASAFLVCGGPSLRSHDLSRLQERGVLACAVNNAAAVVRSQLWVGVDDPGNFCEGIWRDPGIQKFVPMGHLDRTIRVRDAAGDLTASSERVRDMPMVFGLRLNSGFHADRFLGEPMFTWGNQDGQTDEQGNAGVRSVLFVAIKLLYVLGIRRVFLLGCDFRMTYGAPNYAFAQDRTRFAVRSNNHAYRVQSARLAELQPRFEEAGFAIFNCTPQSDLTVFPRLEYTEAIAAVTRAVAESLRTDGMYDRRTPDPPRDAV